MMPMLPPSHLEKLAREHLGSHARLYAARHIEPDGYAGEGDAWSLGPVFMALRRLATTGPLGVVRTRIERWFDAREDRRSRPAATVPPPAVDTEPLPADDAERPIAA